MKKIGLLIGFAAFAAVIFTAVFAYNRLINITAAPQNLAYAEDGRLRAADFTILDQNNNELMLSDFFGKPIVLNFWTTWCPACVREMPYFEKIYREMGDELHILKVNLLDGQRETRAGVDDFMTTNGHSFPIYFDVTGEAAEIYAVRSIPFSVFISAQGYIAAIAQGALDEERLRMGIEMALFYN